MSLYIIRYGSIAALQYVTLPDGRQASAVYLSEARQPAYDINGRPCDPLPLEVRAEINRRFGVVFSLPVERREAAVRAFQPLEVHAANA